MNTEFIKDTVAAMNCVMLSGMQAGRASAEREAEAWRKDAERLAHLHDDPKRAQAYFWNYQGRTERNAAIDAAIAAQASK